MAALEGSPPLLSLREAAIFSPNMAKIICEIINEDESDWEDIKVSLQACNDNLENNWWEITVGLKTYSIPQNKLREFCQAILSIIN